MSPGKIRGKTWISNKKNGRINKDREITLYSVERKKVMLKT